MSTPKLCWQAIGLLILTALILSYSGWFTLWHLNLPTDGSGGSIVADSIIVNQTTDWSSLRLQDSITHIGGHPLRYALFIPGQWQHLLLGQPAAPVTYTLIRDGQTQTIQVTWRKPPWDWFLLRSGTLLILGLAFTLSGAFVAWRRGDDRAARMLALALLAEGFNLFNNLNMTTGINTGIVSAWFSLPVDLVSLSLTFSGFFHCLILFPEVKWLGRRFPRLLYLIHPLNLALIALGGWLGNDDSTLSLRAHMLSTAYILAGLELPIGIAHMMHTYFTSKRTGTRNQIRWLMWGIIISVVPWLLVYNLPYVLTGKPLFSVSLATIPLIMIPITLIFSVARYGLMAVDTLINRSLVYGILTLALIGFNLILAGLFNPLWIILFGEKNETITIILATLIAILTFSAARSRLQKWIDWAFYRGHLYFQNLLREMGEQLSTTLVFDNLVTLLTEYVPARLQLSGATLLTLQSNPECLAACPPLDLSPTHHQTLIHHLQQTRRPLVVSQVRHPTHELADVLDILSRARLETCLPLYRAGRLTGIYALGQKKSGDLFDDREMDILVLLGHQISAALENSRLYREVEEYNRTLENQVQERTKDLRQANKKLADTAWDLAEQRARLDTILQNIADGLVVTDANGRIALTNAVLEQMAGIPASTLYGMSLSQAFSDPNLMNVVQQALSQAGRSVNGEITLSGGRVCKASASALRQGQNVIGATTILRDITHEVQVDRMKTDFISTVSHELRTPLTSVLGFAKLIRRSFETTVLPQLQSDDLKLQRTLERITKNLEIIESESQRLTRLINDVLDIAKMEAGKVEWHMAPTQIGDMIDGAIAAVVGFIGEKPLEIVHQGVPDIPAVTADADRIIQVITNLLSNAIKFAERGQIAVHAWLLHPGDDITPTGPRAAHLPTSLPATQDMLAVSVTDSGIGISESDLNKMFERFHQMGDVLTGRPRGTGLGLPICREIVEHHGGRIWVESTYGQGSRFIFTLPLTQPETAVQPTSSAATTRPATMPPTVLTAAQPARLPQERVQEIRERVLASLPNGSPKGQTILIVDDEPSIRFLLRQELSEAGYQVIEASGGLEAVEIARAQKPDLVLLDVMMPGLSGFDVTSVLKSDERTSHIPILILSIIEDRERGFRLGADDYLTKPIHSDKLLASISSLLRGAAREQRALVVHPDETAVEAITRVLREQGFEVTTAYDPRGAIEAAQKIKPNLVILNAMLSQFNDYQMLKALNYTNMDTHVDILVLSGGSAPEHAPKQDDQP